MNVPLDEQHLLQFLNQHGLQPGYEQNSGQTYITFEIAGFEVLIFFVIQKETELLQLIAYLPYELKKQTTGHAARLLHLLNKELDMPGFGMDENEKVLFYRSVIPCLNGRMNEQLLRLYIAATKIACETFMQVIGMIIAGSLTVEEIIQSRP